LPSELKASIRVLDDFIEPFIERAIVGEHKSGDLVDSLSQFTKDKKVIRDQLINVLLAARDTTASSLSWLFYEFAYHPEIYVKVRDEVLKSIGMRNPTYDDLKNMKYLQHCLNEGMNQVI
jgi:cytochrome P450